MARLLQTGAEWQIIDELNDISGNGAISVSTAQHTGTGSNASYRLYRSDTSWTQDYGYVPIPGTPANVYYKADVKIAAITTNTVACYPIRFYGSNYIASVGITYDGSTLRCFVTYGTSSTKVYDVAISPAIGDWFRVEAHFDSTPADGSEVFEVKINGTTIVSDTNLTLSGKTMAYAFYHVTSSTTGSTHTADMYMDNISINDASGSYNNTWIGEETIVALVPDGSGDSNPSIGTYVVINEIPATKGFNTVGGDYMVIGGTSNTGLFNFSSPLTYMNSYDKINAITVMTMMKNGGSTAASYRFVLQSASGGTQGYSSYYSQLTSNVARATPNGITANGGLYNFETDPTTGSRWKVSGTNSLENAQMGMNGGGSISAMAAMVAYSPGSPPTNGMLIMFW